MRIYIYTASAILAAPVCEAEKCIHIMLAKTAGKIKYSTTGMQPTYINSKFIITIKTNGANLANRLVGI